jgi:hypothetical protein
MEFLARKREELLGHQRVLLDNQERLHVSIEQALATLEKARQAPLRIQQLQAQQAALRSAREELLAGLLARRLGNLSGQAALQGQVLGCCGLLADTLRQKAPEPLKAIAFHEQLLELLEEVEANSRATVS